MYNSIVKFMWIAGLISLGSVAIAQPPAPTQAATGSPDPAQSHEAALKSAVSHGLLFWRTEHLAFMGFLVPSSGPSLRPRKASGVSMVYSVGLVGKRGTLGTAKGEAKVYPTTDRLAKIYPPDVPDSVPIELKMETYTAPLQIELLDDGTFRLIRTCPLTKKGMIVCFDAKGTIKGDMAKRLTRAALKEAPNQAQRDRDEAESVKEIIRSNDEMMQNMANWNNCQPGYYCR